MLGGGDGGGGEGFGGGGLDGGGDSASALGGGALFPSATNIRVVVPSAQVTTALMLYPGLPQPQPEL
jgi:hypothetical protein